MDEPEHINSKKSNLSLKINKKLNDLKDFLDKISKGQTLNKVLIVCTLIVIVGSVFAVYKINEIRTRAFTVYFGDEVVGTTREEDDALNILNDIKKELTNTYDLDIVFNKDIRFEDTHSKEDSITSIEDLKKNIKSKLTFLVSGYVLLIDDEEVGAVKTEKDIEELMDRIKEPYLDNEDEDNTIKESKFIEDVKVEKKNIPLNKIVDKDKLLEYITTGKEEIKEHIVEVGESLWTIATIYDMPVDELIAANPDMDPEKLQIGDKVKLIVPKPMLTVETIEETKYKERVDYEVKVEANNNMYKNEKKVKVQGAPGENEIVAKIVKHNGVVVEKEILEENIIKEPIDELIVKGTKEVPRTVATGSFLMPTRGSISSRYGMRNGRMHKGLDIAARPGTPIKAADGGTVSFAGNSGAYGKLVQINHGNGYITKYAHCSTINVRAGQKVYKGQVIARVGNTGRSTGPHLHFEVVKSGTNVNPAAHIR